MPEDQDRASHIDAEDEANRSAAQANLETEKKQGEICARLTSLINLYGRGLTPPAPP